jgi:cell division septation protein DedD|tara:strand:- start:870 stop:1271 length:402 start_codon:yes stop_codon:yes gene_type:complete
MKERIIGFIVLTSLITLFLVATFNSEGVLLLEEYNYEPQDNVITEEKFFYDDIVLNSKAVWIIQVKSFQKIEEAILFTESLKRMRLNPYIVKKTISDTKIYRVRVYSTDESDNLQNAIKKLEKKGYKFSIIKK